MKFKRILVFALIIILLGLLAYYYPSIQSIATGNVINNNQEYQRETAFVTKIVDGDTIHATVNGKDETIRLLGINNPKGMNT